MEPTFCNNMLFSLLIFTSLSCNPRSKIIGVWHVDDLVIDTTNESASLAILAFAAANAIPGQITFGRKETRLDYSEKKSEVFKYRVVKDSLYIEEQGSITSFGYFFDGKNRLVLASKDMELYLK